METRTIFFVGKPGCGKGTQAELLANVTGWPIFGSGKEFRKIATEDSAVGRKIKKEVMEEGLLAPSWFAMYLYQKALFSIPERQSAIFDGFNRKVPEAELIIDSLHWLGRSFTIVNIVISDQEAIKRVALRKLSSDRLDDNFVPERLKEYEKYTKDAIEIFRQAGTLIDINGEQEREKIAQDIRAALTIA